MCYGFARRVYSDAMGSYTLILKALNELNLTVVLVFSIGCLIGILSFAKLLSKLFKAIEI